MSKKELLTMKQLIIPLLLTLGLSACQTTPPRDTQLSDAYLSHQYNRAAIVASLAQDKKINIDLTPISPNTPGQQWNSDGKVKVVTWKSTKSYEQFLKNNTTTSTNEEYVIWVTAAPQVKKFCKAYLEDHPEATVDDLNLRLKQYLGLKYDWNYDLFIELWVDPKQLFRPCVDPEIDDKRCNLKFGNTIPTVTNIANYKIFFQNLYFKSFRYDPRVPWSGLGYTFDWGGHPSVIGASEYIMIPGASYEIESVTPTKAYCR
jgi:hypothetical protein